MESRSTRRQFLRAGLLLTAGSTLLGHRALPGQDPPKRDEHILVLGAGMAGLAAARDLKAGGFKVTVLEGRDRIGGRIWTDRSLGVPIDLGASWIHGVEGNPIMTLARDLRVKTQETDFEDVLLFDSDGSRLTDDTLEKIGDDFDDLLTRAVDRAEEADADLSLADALKAAAKGNRPAQESRGHQWLWDSAVVTLAEELERLSAKGYDQDEEFDGEDELFPGGYHQIVEAVAKGLDVKLSHKITKISHGGKGVEVTTDQGVFKADRAVCTFPLGVLKSGAITFDPELPKAKREAIGRLGMGVLNKIALRFDKPFWPERTYLSALTEGRNEIPEFLNMGMFGLDGVLVAFTGGDAARAIEKGTDAEAGARATAVLRKMFGSAVPDPKSMKLARWWGDPFSGGSYSHVPLGATIADCDLLAEPVGCLFFAGEATNRRYPGTVHGAWLSGVRAAEEIAEAE